MRCHLPKFRLAALSTLQYGYASDAHLLPHKDARGHSTAGAGNDVVGGENHGVGAILPARHTVRSGWEAARYLDSKLEYRESCVCHTYGGRPTKLDRVANAARQLCTRTSRPMDSSSSADGSSERVYLGTLRPHQH